MIRPHIFLSLLLGILAGCASPRSPSGRAISATAQTDPRLGKDVVLEVLRYVYRWHFDASYTLDAGKTDELEVWSKPLYPKLDPDDRSDYAQMWIPAIKTEVQLKRAEYLIPELNLSIDEPAFKITRVTRKREPFAPRKNYQVQRYSLADVRDYLFANRTNSVPISESLRQSARQLLVDYLDHAYPEPFTTDQIGYFSPLSPVSNELWFFWETGRKLLFFSADVDLTNPGFAQLSQLRMQVIDLDKDVVASTREVPGSNAFVTKDWVGRLLFNCILYGEKVVRTPEELGRLRSNSTAPPMR